MAVRSGTDPDPTDRPSAQTNGTAISNSPVTVLGYLETARPLSVLLPAIGREPADRCQPCGGDSHGAARASPRGSFSSVSLPRRTLSRRKAHQKCTTGHSRPPWQHRRTHPSRPLVQERHPSLGDRQPDPLCALPSHPGGSRREAPRRKRDLGLSGPQSRGGVSEGRDELPIGASRVAGPDRCR